MIKLLKSFLSGAVFALGLMAACSMAAGPALAASLPIYTGASGTNPLNQPQNTGDFNNLVNAINTNIPNTSAGYAGYALPRNYLDNGGMQVQQRGTAAQTCGTTTVPATAYSADRWGCNVNVTSGAGSLQVVTTNLPTSPIFNAAELFYRTSGSLAQPQCVMQEIPSTRLLPLQGQQVTLSFYAYGLALMLAEQTTLNAYLFTGTTADQGLGTFTASPAITPAWAGIASTQTTAVTLTSAYQRFTVPFTVPATAKEAAVALCWTPTTGGTAGATDGFEFTGVQLEQGTNASSFEYRAIGDELLEAQRYYYEIDEAALVFPIAMCTMTTSGTAAACNIQLPVTMRKAPAIATATGFALPTTTGQTALNNCTGFAINATLSTMVAGVNVVPVTCTNSSGTTAALGISLPLYSNSGSGKFQASADF